MNSKETPEHLAALREDLAYHQARVLLLVTAVASSPGHARKLDGLTKLAKLDFLTRYPSYAPRVLDGLQSDDPRLHLPHEGQEPLHDIEAPMIRYKYGPWDDRYYAIIGALIGRGLLKYMRGRKGSIALAPTPSGKAIATELAASREWQTIADRCLAVAETSQGMTGNALKDRIYSQLPNAMDRAHRELIK